MKCPECGGSGKVVNPMMSMNGDECTGEWEQHECEACNGTGEIQQTNEEWMKSCNTEQLAEFLNLIIRVGPYENEPKDFWEHVYGRGGEHGVKSIVTWLKQPHREESEK